MKSVYQNLVLETLGGNHLRRASQALKEDPRYSDCNLIRKRDVVLYIGLTDDETSALAIQHQTDQSGAHPLTLIEKISIVRRTGLRREESQKTNSWMMKSCQMNLRQKCATSLERNMIHVI